MTNPNKSAQVHPNVGSSLNDFLDGRGLLDQLQSVAAQEVQDWVHNKEIRPIKDRCRAGALVSLVDAPSWMSAPPLTWIVMADRDGIATVAPLVDSPPEVDSGDVAIALDGYFSRTMFARIDKLLSVQTSRLVSATHMEGCTSISKDDLRIIRLTFAKYILNDLNVEPRDILGFIPKKLKRAGV